MRRYLLARPLIRRNVAEHVTVAEPDIILQLVVADDFDLAKILTVEVLLRKRGGVDLEHALERDIVLPLDGDRRHHAIGTRIARLRPFHLDAHGVVLISATVKACAHNLSLALGYSVVLLRRLSRSKHGVALFAVVGKAQGAALGRHQRDRLAVPGVDTV